MELMTVVTVSPLTVRQSASTRPMPARLLANGSTWVPSVGVLVVVAHVAGRLYVMGGA